MRAPAQVYWVKRIDNSRLVRQRDPAAARQTIALMAAAVLCGAILLLCAWQHFEFVHDGYRLEELHARRQQVLEWNRTLRLEQAALLDPMRIDLVARDRLGLGAPRADQVVPLGSGPSPILTPVLARARPGDGWRPAEPVSLTD